MPRDYGKITHRFWTGETGKMMRAEPSLEVRSVATYLMTCGSSNMIGLYYLPIMLIPHEVGGGLTLEGASKALRRLGELGFAFYDELEEVVFVPHMAREQIADKLKVGDKQRDGVISLLKEHEKSKFYADFVQMYLHCYHLEGLVKIQAPSKDLPSPFEGPSKPGEQESRRARAETGEQAPSRPGCKCQGETCLSPTLCSQSTVDGIAKAATAELVKSTKIRPRTAHDLELCMRVAIQKSQPQNGPWIPGRFSVSDADKLIRDLGDIEAALPVVEKKIELFAADKAMQPWTMAKFVDKWNEIGLEKLEFGRPKQPAQPRPRSTPVVER